MMFNYFEVSEFYLQVFFFSKVRKVKISLSLDVGRQIYLIFLTVVSLILLHCHLDANWVRLTA